ncbi:MAG: MCP four helix bundle domain-containing protein, partial [Phycisphaerales bacterium]
MLKSMKVGTKLILGFSAVAVIALVLGILGYYGAVKSARSVAEVGSVRLPSVDSSLTIARSAENIRGTLRTLATAGLPEELRERQYDNLQNARREYEKAWAVYEPLPRTSEEAATWEQFVLAWNTWRAESDKAVELAKTFDTMQITDPLALQEQLQAIRGSVWKSIAVLTKMVKAGEQLADTHTVRTFLEDGYRSPFDAIRVQSPVILQGLNDIQSIHQAVMRSVVRIRELTAEVNREEAIREFDGVFQPKAMELVEAMRPLRAEAAKAQDVLRQTQEQILGPVTTAQRTAIDLLDKIVAINGDVARAEVTSSHTQARFFKVLSLTAMIVGVLLAMVLGSLIARSITRPIRRIIEGLTEGAEQVAAASAQVSAASQSLAEGATEQAAGLEETSSSLEEMSSMTKQNA